MYRLAPSRLAGIGPIRDKITYHYGRDYFDSFIKAGVIPPGDSLGLQL
jgi:hypothetical protein